MIDSHHPLQVDAQLHRRPPPQTTLPHRPNPPSHPPEASLIPPISDPVLFDLGSPVRAMALRHPASKAAVAMPEATVDLDDRAEPPEHDVRSAGQLGRVERIAKAHRVQSASDGHLGFGVL
jgi:hypothetical protein